MTARGPSGRHPARDLRTRRPSPIPLPSLRWGEESVGLLRHRLRFSGAGLGVRRGAGLARRRHFLAGDLQVLPERLVAVQAEVYAASEHREKEYAHAYAGLPSDFINYQHDPLACAVALGWDEGVETEELPLNSSIEDGRLVGRERITLQVLFADPAAL